MLPAKPRLRPSLAALAALAAFALTTGAYADHGGRDVTDRDMERADGSHGGRDAPPEDRSASARDSGSNRDGDGRDGSNDDGRGRNASSRGSDADDALKRERRASRGARISTETDREGHERRSREIVFIGSAADIESVRNS